MSHLVIDVGTSSLRAVVLRPDGTLVGEQRRALPPSMPWPGAAEIDAVAMAEAVLDVATSVLAHVGPVVSVGIANQRASTIVWDRQTGAPVGPGLGWQDLRTAGMCLVLAADGIRVAPNASATKLQFLLDTYDPDRSRDLCFGTVDSWVVWTLTGGQLHVTDASNCAVTGLAAVDDTGIGWDGHLLQVLNIPGRVLPRIVDSSGVIGEASVLPGAPVIAGIAGDQQASLLGQACVKPGMAKATFGTGGMLDANVGPTRTLPGGRGEAGCLPIVAWQLGGQLTWGVEAIMLSAGTCVDWLVNDLGVLASAGQSEPVAAACDDTGDVWFVPALLGLGTPVWDYGARGALLGITGGTSRSHIVRAVLEGVAHRGADLLEAAEADGQLRVDALRVDGGMSANAVFVQALADVCQRPVEVSPIVEATALGAGYLAGIATGTWAGLDDVAAAWKPAAIIEPRTSKAKTRDRWLDARSRAERWHPDLSAIDFG